MDKYNIITPTDNLNDLTNDMINWYQMPKKFRDAANDDCMRIYNCYVPQLYNRIKEKILQNMDYADIDDDNITIKESCTSEIDFSKYEKYEEKLKMSKKLQENPYIVIIDPDITPDELGIKFNSYNSLNFKYQRISDDYSFQLWGYNVINMRNIMFDKFNNAKAEDETDNSNVIFKYPHQLKEYSLDVLSDLINTSLIDRNYMNYNKMMCSYIGDSICYESTSIYEDFLNERLRYEVDKFRNSCEEDMSFMPRVVPYFTPKEIVELHLPETKINKQTYIHDLCEAKDDNALLELGWNPSIDQKNIRNLNFARNKIFKYIMETNIENMVTTDVKDSTESIANLYPVYFILKYKSDIDRVFNKKSYEFPISICFDISSYDFLVYDIYTDKLVMNKFDFQGEFEIYTLLLPLEDYEKVQEVINNSIKTGISKYIPDMYKLFNFNTVNYDFIKILFSMFSDTVNNMIVSGTDNVFKKDHLNVYKLFGGPKSEFRPERIIELIRFIKNNR